LGSSTMMVWGRFARPLFPILGRAVIYGRTMRPVSAGKRVRVSVS
jgi:hypothetical protein